MRADANIDSNTARTPMASARGAALPRVRPYARLVCRDLRFGNWDSGVVHEHTYQMDRATGFEPVGRGFDPLRARHTFPHASPRVRRLAFLRSGAARLQLLLRLDPVVQIVSVFVAASEIQVAARRATILN